MATRNFFNLAKRNRTYRYTSQKLYSASAEIKPASKKIDEIIIPYRIHRGPTDILKALASTISKDFTAPQYKYEDDPYFIPPNNIYKRAFALSKESGKKAARYFLEKYPDLFLCNESVPHIKAFDPPVVYTEENVSSENTLAECIKNFEVNNSITVYAILKKKDINVSQEVKQNLLELLCYYNGYEPLEEDYYEERYFQKKAPGEKWNMKGEAERLFDEMEKDNKAYSAMIAGAGKFQNPERAQELFEEMTGKGLIPTVEAYNSLISLVPRMKERRDHGTDYALFLLSNMQKDGLVPNLNTMNTVLEVLFRRMFRKTKEISLSILAEMKALDIEPSLGTYNLILSIFCDDQDNAEIGVLYEIINKIEGKELTARHPTDVSFFCNAMEKCWKLAEDKSLAYRINRIVEYQNNCKLLGNAFSESHYFKCFFRLLCATENLDRFMEMYELYVPNTYVPEPSLMIDILNNIHIDGSYKYLPKLCSDILVFEQSERETILSLILEATSNIKHSKELQQELVDVVWKIVQKIQRRLEHKRNNFIWSGPVLGNAVITFTNGEDIEKSWSIIEKLVKNELRTIGVPEKDAFLKFCELGLEKMEYDKVKACIDFVKKEVYPDFGNDFKKLTEDMFSKEKILSKQKDNVNEILRTVLWTKQPSNSLNKSSSELSTDSSSESSDDSSSDSTSSDEENEK